MSKEHSATDALSGKHRSRSTPSMTEHIPRSPLAALIDELLGCDIDTGQGPDLARFDEKRLASIRRGAEQQADECLSGLQSITHLLAIAASHPELELPNHLVFAVAEHLHGSLQALACWNELGTRAGPAQR